MDNYEYYVFTPGPVKMPDYVLEEGSKQVPYFRTKEFSNITLDCERMLLDLLNAGEGSRVLFLAASGTGAMEAAIVNVLNSSDKAFVVNGGSFGQRFVDICNMHNVDNINHKLDYGRNIDLKDLEKNKDNISTLIVNAHETSTGVLYDLDKMGRFCIDNNKTFIVDAISMFLTDKIDMKAMGIDVLILSSQKGLALPPGLSILVLSGKAQQKIYDNSKNVKMMYLRLSDYLNDMRRGQTPYTPPVGILNQLHVRLKHIVANGGVEAEIQRAKEVADYFRSSIKNLPLKIFSDSMPNAMTSLSPTNGQSAQQIVSDIFDRYNIYICPNGGEIKDKVFRVSHMGDIDKKYTDVLISALKDYFK